MGTKISSAIAVALLLIVGCKADPPDQQPAKDDKAKVAGEPSNAEPAPEPEPPEPEEEEVEQTPCDQMFSLLAKCDKGNPVFRDRRFKSTFLRQCGREVSRPTEYAKAFRDCATSPSCESLQSCSKELETNAAELGPAHVDYMLKNNQRHDAIKFCDDHRDKLKSSPELEKRCGPMVKSLDTEREQHQHGPNCQH